MLEILSKLLNKRGITKAQLSSEALIPGGISEKDQFEKWEKVLSGEEVTVESIKQFCEGQKKKIEMQWKGFGNDTQKNERLIVAHTIYSAILEVTDAKKVERESLEQYLNQIING